MQRIFCLLHFFTIFTQVISQLEEIRKTLLPAGTLLSGPQDAAYTVLDECVSNWITNPTNFDWEKNVFGETPPKHEVLFAGFVAQVPKTATSSVSSLEIKQLFWRVDQLQPEIGDPLEAISNVHPSNTVADKELIREFNELPSEVIHKLAEKKFLKNYKRSLGVKWESGSVYKKVVMATRHFIATNKERSKSEAHLLVAIALLP